MTPFLSLEDDNQRGELTVEEERRVWWEIRHPSSQPLALGVNS